MDERQLNILCIVGSLVSLLAIYLFVTTITPEHVKIGDLTHEDVGRVVHVTGMVSNLNVKDGHAFFTLSGDTGSIKTVAWKNVKSSLESSGLTLREGGSISVSGEIKIYRGELEMILKPES